jgi:hypothetical protein
LEAIQLALGGKEKAIRTLGIGKKYWSELGRLCNDEPIKQGRHRGKHVGKGKHLRDATFTELSLAREIAQNVVMRYLNYLDQKKSNGIDDAVFSPHRLRLRDLELKLPQ